MPLHIEACGDLIVLRFDQGGSFSEIRLTVSEAVRLLRDPDHQFALVIEQAKKNGHETRSKRIEQLEAELRELRSLK